MEQEGSEGLDCYQMGGDSRSPSDVWLHTIEKMSKGVTYLNKKQKRIFFTT